MALAARLTRRSLQCASMAAATTSAPASPSRLRDRSSAVSDAVRPISAASAGSADTLEISLPSELATKPVAKSCSWSVTALLRARRRRMRASLAANRAFGRGSSTRVRQPHGTASLASLQLGKMRADNG
eukprot:scaffold140991_cov169-Phaeocystis_antarctica.AAC.1